MDLTKGERWALLCYAVTILGFIPGMWAASAVEATVLGFPFVLFWAAVMVAVTAAAMTFAFFIKERVDGKVDGRAVDRAEDKAGGGQRERSGGEGEGR